jgi:hypothetical protein
MLDNSELLEVRTCIFLGSGYDDQVQLISELTLRAEVCNGNQLASEEQTGLEDLRLMNDLEQS